MPYLIKEKRSLMELEEEKHDGMSRLLEIENESIDPETKALIMLYEAEN